MAGGPMGGIAGGQAGGTSGGLMSLLSGAGGGAAPAAAPAGAAPVSQASPQMAAPAPPPPGGPDLTQPATGQNAYGPPVANLTANPAGGFNAPAEGASAGLLDMLFRQGQPGANGVMPQRTGLLSQAFGTAGNRGGPLSGGLLGDLYAAYNKR